eukprot:SAG31_NODE_20218_length_580_cov_14.669439_2_plen_64_part_00
MDYGCTRPALPTVFYPGILINYALPTVFYPGILINYELLNLVACGHARRTRRTEYGLQPVQAG